jgi:hypothetical protein
MTDGCGFKRGGPWFARHAVFAFGFKRAGPAKRFGTAMALAAGGGGAIFGAAIFAAAATIFAAAIFALAALALTGGRGGAFAFAFAGPANITTGNITGAAFAGGGPTRTPNGMGTAAMIDCERRTVRAGRRERRTVRV